MKVRRCLMCGMPVLKGLACEEHKPLLANDPWYAAEVLLNTTGAASSVPRQGGAQ